MVALLAAGCAGSSRSRVPADGVAGAPAESSAGAPAKSGAAAPAGSGAGAMAAWRERLAAANCARDQRCGPLWPSEDDCLTEAATWPDYVRFFAGLDQDAYLASTHTLAAAGVLDACIAAVTGTPCDDFRTSYETCLGVLVPNAPRPSGEPCAYDSPFILAPACAPGLDCSEPYVCGVCEPLAPARNAGEHCSASQDCVAGLACVSAVCVPYASLPGEGEGCSGGGACRDGLACLSDSWLCARPAAENQPCEPDANSCLRNLTCVSDPSTGNATCRRHARRGDACPRGSVYGSPAACDRSNWCVFATSDAATGTCDIAPLGAGPCSLFADDGGYCCPAGTYPDADLVPWTELPAACTCKPLLALGAPCEADLQCADGFCGGSEPSGPQCVPPLTDGAACAPADAGHCAAGSRCDLESGACVAECD